jgi:hypothetical protein
MSWSISAIQVKPNETIKEKVEQYIEENPTVVANAAGSDQIRDAIAAATALRSAVSRSEDTVAVSLNGHYNAGCNENPGWASCYITVSVVQVY